MRPKRLALKAASFIAAAALLAAVPLSVPDSAFSTVPMTAYADESAGDLYYTVDGDHAVITGCNYTASSIEILILSADTLSLPLVITLSTAQISPALKYQTL